MNKERLHTLEQHLRNGQLGHDKFCHGEINSAWVSKKKPKDCFTRVGEIGDALGELPTVWPDHWTFTGEFSEVMPVLKDTEYRRFEDVIIYSMRWFDLTREQVKYLFLPDKLGGALPYGASRLRVADHLHAFLVTHSK